MARQKEFDKSIIEKKESVFAGIAEIVFVIFVAVLAVVILRTQASMARGVDGASMQPAYNSVESGYSGRGIYDTVRITKFSQIRRRDIVTFESNLVSHTDANGKTHYKILIKRVIAVGGDYLEFKDSGQGYLEVWLNGELLDEPYLNTDANGKPLFSSSSIKGSYPLDERIDVPKLCYFVMGDNRDNSTDSRYHSVGIIPFRKIEGKVYLDVRAGESYMGALWNKFFGGNDG